MVVEKPKKFMCDNCKVIRTIKPIEREYYECFLNGKRYGFGNLEYMLELFKDYVVTCKMYGKDEVDFKIVKRR